MSDIVERLATARNMAELERAAAHAIDEIERLQQMTKDAAQALNDEERENERLRGLLRESFDGLDDYWVKTPEGVSWILHVSDALGE